MQGLLSNTMQADLLSLIELEGWLEDENQVMLFGVDHIPAWCHDLIRTLPLDQFPAHVRASVSICSDRYQLSPATIVTCLHEYAAGS